MYIPWHGKFPEENRWYRLGFLLLITMTVFTMILFFVSIYTENITMLWKIVTIISPSGLIMFIFYLGLKKKFEEKRIRGLADVILKSTYFLRKDPPNIVEFDNILSSYLSIVLPGPVSLYLLSLARYLEHLRLVIIREHQIYRIDEKTSKLEFPYKKLAEAFYKLSDAIVKLDKTISFDILGNILSQIMMFRREWDGEDLKNFSKSAYTDSCQSISGLLKTRLFLEADIECKQLIKNVRLQIVDELSTIGWQAIIVYWIWIRLSIIETALPLREGKFKFWVGPSRLLADQIDSVILFYGQQDYDHIVQVIIGSFDWRLRVPRFLLKEGLSKSQYESFSQ